MSLHSWYFVAYFGIYLLWPFDEGPRFMLPIAPLAFALLWEGVLTAVRLLQTATSSMLKLTAALASAVFIVAIIVGNPVGVQAHAFVIFWACTAAAALILQWMRLNWTRVPSVRVVLAAVVLTLLLVGVFQQISVARTNLNPDPMSFRHAPSIDCAEWLAGREGVVMAQQSAILHRLLGRRVVDFPITSRPHTVAQAIGRENVRYLVVNDPVPYEYFFPTEQARMQVLKLAYPNSFRIVHVGPGYRIFDVGGLR